MTLKEKISTGRTRRSSKISHEWFRQDKTDEEKQETERVLINSSFLFDRFKAIIETEFDKLIAEEDNLNDINFELKHARDLGYKQALKHIYRLLP